MNYQEVVQYLYNQTPDFQKIGAKAYKVGIENMLEFDKYLSSPHQHFKIIHVAGTNGKGSTSHMLASVFQTAGYKVGLYSSPHLLDFRERIKVNGVEISEEFVINFTLQHKDAIERICPSFFEVTTAMSFDYFAKVGVDIAIIEVGLGGRLDSTNIVKPEVSVITNISYDHVDMLGNTLPLIAEEKSGIIKQHVPVIVGEWQEQTYRVFEEKAKEADVPIVFADREYDLLDSKFAGGLQYFKVKGKSDGFIYEVGLDLLGVYQKYNILTVLATLDNLMGRNVLTISQNSIRDGLRNVVKNTNLQGRWQVLQRNPKIICDIAHNVDGLTQTMEQLQRESYKKLYFVFGMVADKDVSGALALLPKDAFYYFTQANIPRALDAILLKNRCAKYGLQGVAVSKVSDALGEARKVAGVDDVVYIGGSTFVVAEALDGYDG
ncbi:MAG: bifunctional folylpolyglutamate synthase/dihydrofolate synthase [Prevotellaceae bacterium]|jgi:dihydrofolate synthase/folylpolyglutamate synthase|nr:bifunctional folylpolyglutamate synthase/dihydrofolate synthase [Prevotellaceae bacterium]